MSDTLKDTAQWFVEAIRTPNDDNRLVQIGVHFEEVAEMFEAMGGLGEGAKAMHMLADAFKKKEVPQISVDRTALLDALADQIVTATGVAHMFGLDIVGALQEVNRSNYSKFVDGKAVFNENGKITKGPNYSKPVLASFVGEVPNDAS